MLQVQRDQCGENPASAAGAQAAEGHQQSKGIKGLHVHLRATDVSTVCIRCVLILCFTPAVPACGAVRVCGHQDHRQHRHRHHVAPVYVCLHWCAALQGKEEIRWKK